MSQTFESVNLSETKLTVKEIRPGDDLTEAKRIRQQVFVAEQGIPSEIEDDGCDWTATHVVVFKGTEPVATGRVLVDGVVAFAARIAVLPEHRGLGIARKVIAELERMAREAGTRRIVIRPHAYLEHYYAQLGYARVGDAHVVSGHPLIEMQKELEVKRRFF